MHRIRVLVKEKKQLLFFLLYAFAIPLLCGLTGNILQLLQEGAPSFILFGIQAGAPFLAAIAATVQFEGFSGLKRFLKQKYLTGFRLFPVVLAVLLPFAILTMARAFTYGIGYGDSFFSTLRMKKIVIVFWALIAEELGWRGYLQDKLTGRVKEALLPVMTGVVWAAWHYHYFLFGTMDQPLLIFGYGCIAESFGYDMVTKMAKGNIIPASIWHFTGNLFFNLYAFSPQQNAGNPGPFVVANFMYTLLILLFIWYNRRRNLCKNQ